MLKIWSTEESCRSAQNQREGAVEVSAFPTEHFSVEQEKKYDFPFLLGNKSFFFPI